MNKTLTRCEARLVAMLSETGDSNKRLASRLGVTEATVKVHLKSASRKLGGQQPRGAGHGAPEEQVSTSAVTVQGV